VSTASIQTSERTRTGPFSMRKPGAHDKAISDYTNAIQLNPKDPERMRAWPVSSRVNSPKNDDAEIIVPVELES
jgi:hypothetical protein